jgi:RimJ/RimL family protein N-acetyltransferase
MAYKKPITLKSKSNTVWLKQLTLKDAPLYFALVEYDRKHLSQFDDVTAKKYQSVEDVKKSIKTPPNPDKYRFGIWAKDTMVGSINLTPDKNNSAELGVWVGKQYIGNHYAAKAGVLLLQFAFEQKAYDSVFCSIHIGNEASRKTAERAGFTLTKTTKNKWIYTLTKTKFLTKRL